MSDDEEFRATLRIDAGPSGKRFQGVWLELASGERWLIDYRANEPWLGFADHDVIVRGHRYSPPREAQQIMAQHFAVSALRFAGPTPAGAPYVSVTGVRRVQGELSATSSPPGSKLAGRRELRFDADDGTSYRVFGDNARRGRATVTGYALEPNMAYAAQPGGPILWISSVHADEPP